MRSAAAVVVGVLVLWGGSQEARAQAVAIGHAIEPEQNAIAVTGLAGLTDGATVLGATGGYSHRGLVDVSLVFSNYIYDDSADLILGDDASAIAIGPSVAVHVLRQNLTTPISVMVLGDFTYTKVRSDGLEDADASITGWAISAGGAVYRRIAMNSQWTAVPWGGISLVRGSVTIDTPAGSESDSDVDGYLQLHGTFVYSAGSVAWTIDPFLAIADDEIIGVYVGALFGG